MQFSCIEVQNKILTPSGLNTNIPVLLFQQYPNETTKRISIKIPIAIPTFTELDDDDERRVCLIVVVFKTDFSVEVVVWVVVAWRLAIEEEVGEVNVDDAKKCFVFFLS